MINAPATRSVPWRLMLVTDRHVARRDFLDIIEQVCAAGVGAVQLREKDLSDKEYFFLANRVQRITQRHGVPLIVNHRVGTALALETEGIHLGGRSLPHDVVRRLLGEDTLIGATAHTLEEARVSGEMGADYIVFGPVYDKPNKKGLVSTTGLDPIRDLKRVTTLPIFAFGGIMRSNLREALAAGFDGAATLTEVMTAENPGQVIAEMRAIVEEHVVHT